MKKNYLNSVQKGHILFMYKYIIYRSGITAKRTTVTVPVVYPLVRFGKKPQQCPYCALRVKDNGSLSHTSSVGG